MRLERVSRDSGPSADMHLLMAADSDSAHRRRRRFPDEEAVGKAIARWSRTGFDTFWHYGPQLPGGRRPLLATIEPRPVVPNLNDPIVRLNLRWLIDAVRSPYLDLDTLRAAAFTLADKVELLLDNTKDFTVKTAAPTGATAIPQ